MVKLTDIEKKQAEIEKQGHEGHERISKEEKAKEAKAEGKTGAKKTDQADKMSAGVAKPGVLQHAKKEETKPVKVLTSAATLHDLDVILYPLVTEKAVNMIEAENKITFIVNDNATKPEVKKVLEEAYGIKVNRVNMLRDMKGRKKAIVQIDKKFKAGELATKLGVL
jgi:large subunit ribosomal protein L23